MYVLTYFCLFQIFFLIKNVCMCANSLQSCPTLCDTMDCSLPRLLCPWDSPGKNTGVCCHFRLHGIFPTQELNPGFLHCRQILYQLSYEGSPMIKTIPKKKKCKKAKLII